MNRREILKAAGMPLAAPSFGAPPYRLLDRAVLTVAYESDADVVRATLPEPLEPVGATVSVRFTAVPESPFGAYSTCGVFLAARLNRRTVDYCHALVVDQEEPVLAFREIWGLPATRGEPELIVGENRATGFLDLGYGSHLRASIPVADESAAGLLAEPALATCKLIPGANGKPAIAQLVSLAPTQISMKDSWNGSPQMEVDGTGPLEPFPVRRLLSGRYERADMTLPRGRVMHDYLSAAGKI